jgi:transcriptional regulator with XRE-family HTH domain
MNPGNSNVESKFSNPHWGIGQFLAYLRKLHGAKSQSDFAARLGISRFYLSNIESGRTPLKLKTALAACRLIDIHPDFLTSRGKHNRAPFPTFEDDDKKRADALLAANGNANFLDIWPAISAYLFPGAENDSNYDLTNPAISAKLAGVKNQWTELKRRIQKAACNPGTKTTLANFLRVDLTQLSKWLTDSKSAREPGADYTLKMLHWVEQIERQK